MSNEKNWLDMAQSTLRYLRAEDSNAETQAAGAIAQAFATIALVEAVKELSRIMAAAHKIEQEG